MAAPGATPGADRTAVGGQTSDARLFMDGDQVREHQRAVQPLLGAGQRLGVLNDRDRHRNALVAAAGVDDDGQLAAAHARVGTRCGLGNSAVAHIVAVKF